MQRNEQERVSVQGSPHAVMAYRLCGSQQSNTSVACVAPSEQNLEVFSSQNGSFQYNLPLPAEVQCVLACTVVGSGKSATVYCSVVMNSEKSSPALLRMRLPVGGEGNINGYETVEQFDGKRCDSSISLQSDASSHVVLLRNRALHSPDHDIKADAADAAWLSNAHPTLAGGLQVCIVSLIQSRHPGSNALHFTPVFASSGALSLILPRHLQGIDPSKLSLVSAATMHPPLCVAACLLAPKGMQRHAEVVCRGGVIELPNTWPCESACLSPAFPSGNSFVIAAAPCVDAATSHPTAVDEHASPRPKTRSRSKQNAAGTAPVQQALSDCCVVVIDASHATLLSWQRVSLFKSTSDCLMGISVLRNGSVLLASQQNTIVSEPFEELMQPSSVLSTLGTRPFTTTNEYVLSSHCTEGDDASAAAAAPESETVLQEANVILREKPEATEDEQRQGKHAFTALSLSGGVKQPLNELLDEGKFHAIAERAKDGEVPSLEAIPGFVRELLKASDAHGAAEALEALFVHAATVGFSAASDLLVHSLKDSTAAQRVGRVLRKWRRQRTEASIQREQIEQAKLEAAASEGWHDAEHVLHLLAASQARVALPELRDVLALLKPPEAEALLIYTKKWLGILMSSDSNSLRPSSVPSVPSLDAVVAFASAALDVHCAGLAAERRFESADALRHQLAAARAACEGAAKVHGATWHLMNGRHLPASSDRKPTSYSIEVVKF